LHPAAPTDAVFLLPGFLGFDRLNDFHYFSDRAVAVLRTALSTALGADVPVIPLCTRPTDALVVRQRDLRARITAWVRYLDARGAHLERLHLVGHSTGGVDAWLLLCEEPLVHRAGEHRRRFEGTWGDFAELHRKLLRGASVALAAPFQGASIATSDALQLFGDFPHQIGEHRRGLVVLGQASILLGKRALERGNGWSDLAINLSVDSRASRALICDVLRSRELVDDLVPEAMADLMDSGRFEGEHEVACFATVAPRPADPLDFVSQVTNEKGARTFYRLCHDEVGRSVDAAFADRLAPFLATMNSRRAPEFGVSGHVPENLEPFDCDGIVNTGAMLPTKGGGLSGLVVADHANVIGHFTRMRDDYEGPGAPIPGDEGLFESGAGFDDAAFFALYQAAATAIANRRPRPTGAGRAAPRPTHPKPR
jgi:hypothetical protein